MLRLTQEIGLGPNRGKFVRVIFKGSKIVLVKHCLIKLSGFALTVPEWVFDEKFETVYFTSLKWYVLSFMTHGIIQGPYILRPRDRIF